MVFLLNCQLLMFVTLVHCTFQTHAHVILYIDEVPTDCCRCECGGGGCGGRVATATARGARSIQLRGALQDISRRRRSAARATACTAPTPWCASATCNALFESHHPFVFYSHLPLVEIETPGSAPRLVATVTEVVVSAGADFCIPCVATDHPPPHYTYAEIP